MLRWSLRHTVLLAAFALNAPCVVAQSDPHFPADRPLDLTHLKLDLRVDLKKKTAGGAATLDLTALRDAETITLNAVDFDVSEVKLLGPGNETATPVKFVNDGKTITITLPATLKPGEKSRVQIEYKVTDPVSGLSFFAPNKEDPEAPYVVWSQGESVTNRYWVPCFDHPNERQTTEIVCTVDKPNMAISNGRLLKKSDNPDGTATYHWLQDKPHVSYLMTLVVGEYVTKTEQWRGKPISYHVREKFKDQIDNSFADTTKMLEFFSTKIGVEYPWDKYDQVCCYNFGGGMENTSATTLTEGTLHDDRAHLDDDSDNLVAHELAHQWWGDLVTCKDWAHLWLNEGFASYFEALWDEHDLGAEEFACNMMRKARAALDGGKDKPIVYRRYEDPDEQFDSRAYPKGAWVLHMIRRRLGDELYWKVLKEYATRYAYQTVETSDLRRVIEDVTGRAFERFFYDWTERSGAPVVTIEYEWQDNDKLAKVRVQQTQKDDAFAFPLLMEFIPEQGGVPVRLTREITTKSETFYIPIAARPIMFRPDPENAVLMDLSLEMPRDCWEQMLKIDPNPVARIRAAKHFGKGRSQQDKKLLADQLMTEKFWAVQQVIAEQLGELQGDVARDALLAALNVENHKTRAAVVEALGKFEDEKAVEDALLAVVKKGDRSYRVEAAAIEAYAGVKGSESIDLLKTLMPRESDNEIIRRSVLRAIGKEGDKESLDLLMDWSATGKPSQCRSSAVQALADVLDREDVGKDHEKKAVEALAKCLKKGPRRLQISALMALEKLGPKARPALDDVERLGKTGGPRAKSTAMRVAKKIRDGGIGDDKLGDLRTRLGKLETENESLKDRIQTIEARDAAEPGVE
ncbi:MAG: M1 family metallopeptidase [Planctomycetota bacterium]